MLTHAQIWDAIDSLARKNGLSVSGLAKLAGLDPTTFNKSKRLVANGRERWPSTESLSKILEATDTDITSFVTLIQGDDDNIEPAPVVVDIGIPVSSASKHFDASGFVKGKNGKRLQYQGQVANGGFWLRCTIELAPYFATADYYFLVQPSASLKRGDIAFFADKKDQLGFAKIDRVSGISIKATHIEMGSHFEADPSAKIWISKITDVKIKFD